MKKSFLCVFLPFIFLFILSSCDTNNDIKIGLSVSITGTDSVFGLSVKDGVEFAIEEINENGGVNGRKMKLVVKDDENNPVRANQADQELIDEGVCAIIGHVTSSISKSVLPRINENKMLLISPTVSSRNIVEENDLLISLGSANQDVQRTIAECFVEKDNIQRLSIIYDINNLEYSEYWINLTRSYLKGSSVQIIDFVEFNSQTKNVDFYKKTNELLSNDPDGILIIASALHTANICQQVYKMDKEIKIYTTTWAFDNVLIENGGVTVESILLTTPYDKHSDKEKFVRFKKGFTERYGEEPEFASAFAYETVYVLYEALLSSGSTNPLDIRDAIIKISDFEGLTDTIQINSNGASFRNIFLYTVKDGHFKKITD